MTNNAIDRRTALYGAAAVVAGAALVACGDSSTGSTAAATPSSADPTSIGTAIGFIAPTSSSAAAAAAASGNSLGATSAVAVGGGVIYTAQKVVVTQPTAGAFKCFTAVCTHQGCIVGTVANGEISCPCHGSAYSIKDGSVINGPATQPLKEEKVTVANGQIALA